MPCNRQQVFKIYNNLKKINTMENNNDQLPLWEVFIQKGGSPFKHEGSIHASDKNMALQI